VIRKTCDSHFKCLALGERAITYSFNVLGLTRPTLAGLDYKRVLPLSYRNYFKGDLYIVILSEIIGNMDISNIMHIHYKSDNIAGYPVGKRVDFVTAGRVFETHTALKKIFMLI
jgi:hypothetical protein